MKHDRAPVRPSEQQWRGRIQRKMGVHHLGARHRPVRRSPVAQQSPCRWKRVPGHGRDCGRSVLGRSDHDSARLRKLLEQAAVVTVESAERRGEPAHSQHQYARVVTCKAHARTLVFTRHEHRASPDRRGARRSADSSLAGERSRAPPRLDEAGGCRCAHGRSSAPPWSRSPSARSDRASPICLGRRSAYAHGPRPVRRQISLAPRRGSRARCLARGATGPERCFPSCG